VYVCMCVQLEGLGCIILYIYAEISVVRLEYAV